MLSWLQNTRTAIILSVLNLLLFLERIILDFRYVSLEMEAVRDIFPFTAPYMLVSFFVFGLWIWGLLAAVQGKRGAFITLLMFNLLALLLAVSTLVYLCPTPCQTGAPLADVLDWSLSLVAIIAAISAALTYRSQKMYQAQTVAGS